MYIKYQILFKTFVITGQYSAGRFIHSLAYLIDIFEYFYVSQLEHASECHYANS